jgi:hypothetical protein
MLELFFAFAITVIIFALFLLAFYLKGRHEGDDAAKPSCARCNCHRHQTQQIQIRATDTLEQLPEDQRA